MRNLIPVAVIVVGVMALAELIHANEVYLIKGQEKTKIEAIKTLIQNPNELVMRCKQVELTDKVTLKNVVTK